MGKAKVTAKVDYQVEAQFVEVGGKKLVIMDEEEYDRLLDVIDAIQAERIASDPSDRVLPWAEIKDRFMRNRVAEVREGKGVTQKELARRLKVKQSTVSRMERAEANLTLATLRRVAKALACSVHELIA
jgi:DNA-binding XRE family transcriptional regulator